MQVNNSLYSPCNSKIAFQAKIIKWRKQLIRNEIKQFSEENISDYGNISALGICASLLMVLSYLNCIAPFIVKKDLDASNLVDLSLIGIFRNLCISIHDLAIEKSPQLADELNRKGFSHEERRYGVNKFLTWTGCPIHSTLFKLTESDNLDKLADGKPIKESFKGFPKSLLELFKNGLRNYFY